MHAETRGGYRVETVTSCPACGGTELADWVTGRDQLLDRSDEAFLYARCGTCGAYAQKRRPTEDSIAYFYQGDYGPYGRKTSRAPPFRVLHKLLMSIATRISGEHRAKLRIRDIYSRLTPSSALLDFGCGSGRALDERRKQFGCRTIGLDFDTELVTQVASRGHKAYLANDAGWSQVADQSVDIVTMNHVIEHLYRPVETLMQIRRVLKPGGLLDIATPNPDGYAAQTFRSDWFGLDCPRHIVLYGPEAASIILRRAGFADLTVIGNPVIKDAVRSKARRDDDFPAWSIESDGWRALKSALLVRREAAHGRYEQYHLIAKLS